MRSAARSIEEGELVTRLLPYASPRMSRPLKLIGCCLAALALVLVASACGSENPAPQTNAPLHTGQQLFSQRCSGCHTFSYAAAHGSAANVRTAQYNNGPNFDIRCERPMARVLYAIENGGFSGAIMPQNIVTGSNAVAVARFVATYSGRQAPKITGVTPCQDQPISHIPTAAELAAASKAASGASQVSAASGNKAISGTAGGSTGKTSGAGNVGNQQPG